MYGQIGGFLLQQEEEKKMRDLAVFPPMLLDERQKKLRFMNNNGLLDDPKAINEETLSKSHYWTDVEREIFREKYLQRPKNFGYIASALHNKVRYCLYILLYFVKFRLSYEWQLTPSMLWCDWVCSSLQKCGT